MPSAASCRPVVDVSAIAPESLEAPAPPASPALSPLGPFTLSEVAPEHACPIQPVHTTTAAVRYLRIRRTHHLAVKKARADSSDGHTPRLPHRKPGHAGPRTQMQSGRSFRRPRLLVAERVDRIELRRAAGGEEAERDPGHRARPDAQDDRAAADRHLPPADHLKHRDERAGEGPAGDSAENRQRDGFDEKLRADLPFARRDPPPNRALAGALVA